MTLEDDPLRRRLDRERRARREAEAIAERVTGELYSTITQLEETNSKLEAANEAIRDFVAIASHDIRNPLTFILGATQLLLDHAADLDEERRADLMTSIVARGHMLDRLVGDLLTVSKLDAGVMETHAARIK